MMKRYDTQPAFTLAELLIALAILGVIATFTIPKILDSGGGSQNNAIVKEAASTVSGALQAYKMQNTLTASTSFQDLTPYINYVNIDSTTVIDSYNNTASVPCATAVAICIRLHNGAMLRGPTGDPFGDTTSTSAIYFWVDPDGQYGGSTTGPSKAAFFFIYTNLRLTTYDSLVPATYNDAVLQPPVAGSSPEYLNWSN